MPDDEILTVPEAAKLLKISETTCYNWIHIEGFPCVKIGNCRRIPRTLLLEWVNEQAKQQKAPASVTSTDGGGVEQIETPVSASNDNRKRRKKQW